LARIEITVALISIVFGLIGFYFDMRPLELLAIVGAVFTFGLLVARVLVR